MVRGKSTLEWTNIGRGDLEGLEQAAWDKFIAAKDELEHVLGTAAVVAGAASEQDTFRFSYARIGQGTVGMAIDAQKAPAQSSGFGGLKRPQPRENLADWARDRDMRGYRR